MTSQPIKPIFMMSFGHHHAIKNAFKKGLMPKDFKGIYGKVLTLDTVSIEHITPRSKGGKLRLNNVALADRATNRLRGSKPIEEFVTRDMWIDYLKQFKKVRSQHFNGFEYIKVICKRFGIKVGEVMKK